MAENVPQKELHRIVPTAIIYKKESGVFAYLLTRRKLTAKVHPGKWNVPGGGLSTDDYLNEPALYNQWYGVVEKALRREVKEEVGLVIGECTYLTDLTFVRPDGVPVLVLSYYAPYVSGEVLLDEDTIDSAWATLAEAKKYDLIPGTFEEIEMVDERLTKGAQ